MDGRASSWSAGRRAERRSRDGVEANARLTAGTAVVLLVLLAAEGVTVLKVGRLLTWHVAIGLLLVPPILLKTGTTMWRFGRYYLGAPAYREKGPPPLALRLLGPFLVALTLVMFGSGVALLIDRNGLGGRLLTLHKASFVLWFFATAVHVLGHLVDTARIAPRDWLRRGRRRLPGATGRVGLILASLVLGAVLAIAFTGPGISHYRGSFAGRGSGAPAAGLDRVGRSSIRP